MPACTGKPDIFDIYTCQYCKPKGKSDYCVQVVALPGGDEAHIPCTSQSCTRAGFKTHDAGLYYQHLESVHSFPNTPEINSEYTRLLSMPKLDPQSLVKPAFPTRGGHGKSKGKKR